MNNRENFALTKAKMICYCGHDCSKCITYLATANNDDSLRKQAQNFYKEAFVRDIPLNHINCRGGRSDDIFFLCKECPFVKCCREKNIEGCRDCESFPCKSISDYQIKYVNKSNQIRSATMSRSYCGINCNSCQLNTKCCGCVDSEGRPFGSTCIAAECCKDCKETEWKLRINELKEQLIEEFNNLCVPGMPSVEELYHLKGSYINLEFTLEDGSKIRYWDDDRIYLGVR